MKPSAPAWTPRSSPWYRASFCCGRRPCLGSQVPRDWQLVPGRLQPGEHRGNDHDGLAAVRVRELAAKRRPARWDSLQKRHECAAVVHPHPHLRKRRASAFTAYILPPQPQPVRFALVEPGHGLGAGARPDPALDSLEVGGRMEQLGRGKGRGAVRGTARPAPTFKIPSSGTRGPDPCARCQAWRGTISRERT